MNKNQLLLHFKTATWTVLLLTTLKINAQNVMISNLNNPNEPSIMIDPKHTNVLVAGANINNYYVSLDSGYTWTTKKLTSSYGVWGDPAITVDTASNFYFFHLSNPASGNWIDRIVCQKTTDNGAFWSNGTHVGLNGTKAQDKQWCAVDRTNNNLYLTWTQFDAYGSTNPADSSTILFSKSTDAGSTWTEPKRINKVAGDCIDGNNTVEGAVPAVGPNGEIYVSWAGPNGLVFNKSTNQGETWLNKEVLIDAMPGGWNFAVSGIYRANGLPVTACDVSNSEYRGTIYVNWSDQRNGANNTDIWLAKSTNGGQTWSAPKRVNNDTTTKQQFFTWMTIDQTNGYLYFVFYDRRNHTSDSTDVYMACSTDGGNTFTNKKISETPFKPIASIFFGDYTNITAHNGIIRPIWTRLNNGKLSIWTNITSANQFLSNLPVQQSSNHITFDNYPNPTTNEEYVSFKLHGKSNINLVLYDISGKKIAHIIKNETRDYGKYVEKISLASLGISQGTYLLKLEIDGTVKVNRLIKF